MTLSTEVIDVSPEPKGFFATVKTKISETLSDLKEIAPDADQVKSGVASQTARVGKAYSQVKRTVTRDNTEELAQMLKEWAPALKSKSKDSQAMVEWLTALPSDDLERFTRKLSAFLASFKLDLTWLVNPETAKVIDPNLAHSLTEVVQHYGLANWKANQLRPEVNSLVALQAWLDNPTAKKYGDFNRQMFAKMVEAKLVNAPSMELFLADEDKRQGHFSQAIREVMAKDPAAFNKLLKEHLATAGPEPTPNEVVKPTAEAPTPAVKE
jgi:hypothetical protein